MAIAVAVLVTTTGLAKAATPGTSIGLVYGTGAAGETGQKLSQATLTGTETIFLSGNVQGVVKQVSYYPDDGLGDAQPIVVTAAPFALPLAELNAQLRGPGTHILLADVVSTSGVSTDLFARYTIGDGTAPAATATKKTTTTTTGTQTGATAGKATNGIRLYADDSFWNTPIPANAAVDPGSQEMISGAIVSEKGESHFANSDYGVPFYWSSASDGNSVQATISCTQYCEWGNSFDFLMPSEAEQSSGSDGHLVVVNKDTMEELDMWLAEGSGAQWTAASVATSKADGWGANCALGEHCNGANAAGFAQMGGVVRPEEVESGVIDHALAINTPHTRSGIIVCPATHTDGKTSGSQAIPEGARVQLDPTLDIESQGWEPWQKAFAKAFQVYGAYVVDTSGALTVRGQSNADWSMGKDASLNWLPWEQMHVLEMKEC